ncbi:hypothetical protein PYW07_009846 [Mythimna separata]|uniref:Cytochrome P450 n=1 Tax=Mythimna separata TaxID=271217 RepID=A0AAD7YI00_MYTSE|nr:hypothetical protein PYW07_009846 [Mythimna separata]
MFAVVLLCIACFAYWCWCRQRAKTAEPPSLPGAWPLVGHLPLFFGDGCKIWNQMTNAIDQGYDVGGTAKIHLGPITVYVTALGVGFTDSNLASDYLHAADSTLNAMLERFIKFWWHSPYTFAWSKLKKKQDAYLKVLHKMSDAVLQKRKSELFGNTCVEKNITPGTKFKPFVDILLELSIEKGAFNDEQIRAQVDFMLAAGHETTPNALLFTMVLLGSHHDVQEKVFSEIQEVLGGNKDVEKMDLSRLQYLEAVVKESLRLFTVVPQIARKLEKDVKLSKTYAMMSMKTTLAHVVRSYRIKADHTKMRLKYVATLKPDNDGHYISIEKRT